MVLVSDLYLKNAPIGFISIKRITIPSSSSVDYEIININDYILTLVKNARHYLSIKRLSVLSEKLGQSNIFDWIASYYERVKIEKKVVIEKYADIFSGWFRFTLIFEQEETLCLWIENITAEKIINESSQQMLDGITLDYHDLAEKARKIASAKYCLMNVFTEDEKHFKTVAAAGKRSDLKTTKNILGFNLENTIWESDPHFLDKLRQSTISKFKTVNEFMGDSISSKLLNILMKALNIGDFYLCKIQKDQKFVGIFTFATTKNTAITNTNQLITYSKQVGLYLLKNKAKF